MLESSSGLAGDDSGCLQSPLLGFGTRLVEFWRFAFLRCLVSLPFRADGIGIFDFFASGVPPDFQQPSRSAFQPQVRSAGKPLLSPGGSLAVTNSSAQGYGGAMGFGVWLNVVGTLSVCEEIVACSHCVLPTRWPLCG